MFTIAIEPITLYLIIPLLHDVDMTLIFREFENTNVKTF
jgi:hypothetical protein